MSKKKSAVKAMPVFDLGGIKSIIKAGHAAAPDAQKYRDELQAFMLNFEEFDVQKFLTSVGAQSNIVTCPHCAGTFQMDRDEVARRSFFVPTEKAGQHVQAEKAITELIVGKKLAHAKPVKKKRK